MNNKCTPEDHIENVTKQCGRLIGMIFRTFTTRDVQSMLTLFKTLILPKIDYCSIAWAPNKICDIRAIERIQANFTKRIKINGNNEIDYWDRLKELNLYSIQRRFERYTIIYMWKILHGLVVNPGIEFHNEESRNGIISKIPKYTIELREGSFMVKGPKLFNSISKELREFPCINRNNSKYSILTFKKKLDKYLKTIPDQPNMAGEYTRRMDGVTLMGDRTNSILRIN